MQESQRKPESATSWKGCVFIYHDLPYRKNACRTSAGNIRYPLRTPYSDGTTHVAALTHPYASRHSCIQAHHIQPAGFHCQLASPVPKPRVNRTRFHGVIGGMPHHPDSKHRALITPAKHDKGNTREQNSKTDDRTPAIRHAAMTWALTSLVKDNSGISVVYRLSIDALKLPLML